MHDDKNINPADLEKENLTLKSKIAELEDTLKSITDGDIDALLSSETSADKIFIHESQQSVYRLIIEEMNEAALTLSEDGIILFCNRSFANYVQIPKENLLGKSILEFVSDENKQQLIELIKLGTHRRGNCEIKLISSTHITTHLHFDLYPFPSENINNVCVIAFDLTKILEKESQLNDANLTLEKRVSERTEELRHLNKEINNSRIAALNMMQDTVEAKNKLQSVNENLKLEIAERIKAEESIRKSEERFRDLFDKHAAVKLIADPKTGKIVDANQAALQFYGYSKSQITSMFVKDINIFSEDKVAKEMNNVVHKEKVFFEFRHRLADGTLKDVEVFSSKINIDGQPLLHSIIHDVSDKRVFEKQLKLHSKSLEQSPVSVAVTDTEGIIEYVNPKFSQVSGYSKEEAIGKKISIIKSDVEPLEKYQQMWNTIKSGNDWFGEFQNKKKCGELFWENVSISPIKDEDGTITNFVAVKEDITEKKKMLEDLIEAKELAEESNRLKSEFLAQMSHEIRTPLNVIVGNHSLIRELVSEDFAEEFHDVFDGIESSSRRIIRTIDLILNAAELQTGRYEPHLTNINLNTDVFRRLISEFKSSVQVKNLEFNYENFLENPVVTADEYSLIQIFANLIDNSIKYTKAGSITLKCFANHQDIVTVELIDTGIGMSEEFLKKIFHPFVQEEKGYSRTYEGNGLGLSLVKEYCKLNNALIQVESKKNHGSTFRVIFN